MPACNGRKWRVKKPIRIARKIQESGITEDIGGRGEAYETEGESGGGEEVLGMRRRGIIVRHVDTHWELGPESVLCVRWATTTAVK